MPELKPILADLHLHTVLSACAEVEMIPPLIVRRALQMGLGMIAVTDHNACGNAAAVIAAAAGTGLAVLPGMELQTREEVHLLCLFGTLGAALDWQEVVRRALPPLANVEEYFGAQYVVDHEGRHVATEERLLQVSAELELEEAIAGVHALGGLAIPAHIDRPSFSLLANLGLVPPGLAADALEVTARWQPPRISAETEDCGLRIANCGIPEEERTRASALPVINSFNPQSPDDGAGVDARAPSGIRNPQAIAGFPVIMSGDAHRLTEMRKRTLLFAAGGTLAELKLALQGESGRKISVTPGD